MTSLILDVIGRDHASKVLKDVGSAAQGAEGKMSKLKAAGAVALTALAAGAVEFGKKSVEKFQEVGGETLTLQRQLGLTAQQASRLRFAGEETGVAASSLGLSFGILSKHLAANDKAWQSLGISTKDAQGKTKSMNDLIPEIAQAFASMPNGPKKTAEALKVFGKSGKDLLPFLNKGKDGLKELGKESDKYGDTLNSKETQAVYKNVIAKRQLGAAVSGLEIQFGQKLIPVITSVVTAFSGAVLWFSRLGTTGKTIIGIAGVMVGLIFAVVKAMKAWTAIQAAFNVEADANPVGLIVLAVAALAVGLVYAYKKSQTFRDIVNGCFHAIQVVVGAVVGFIRDHWKLMLGIITGPVGLAVAWIVTHWGTVKNLFAGAAKWIGKALHGVESAIEAPFKAAFAVIKAAFAPIQDIINVIGSVLGNGQGGGPGATGKNARSQQPAGRAGGGSVFANVAYRINERAGETVTFPAGGTVHPASLMPSSGRGGDTYIINVPQTAGDPHAFARSVQAELLKLKRSTGSTNLGLA